MPTVAHPTAATDLDHSAFLHAVAIARSLGPELVLIHVGADRDAKVPEVGPVLERWRAKEPVSIRQVVHPWGDADPAEGVLDALEQVEPDLCVLATSRRDGIARALLESRAEAIARHAPCPVLIVPEGCIPFVNEATGALELTRVVVPVGDNEAAKAGVEGATRFLDGLSVRHAEIVLLHRGAGRGPAVELASDRAVTWREVEGASLESSVEEASAHASLIVMATRGRNSVIDVLLGTHTERVVQRARCPVLQVRIPS